MARILSIQITKTMSKARGNKLTEDQQKQLDIQEHEDEIFYSPRCASTMKLGTLFLLGFEICSLDLRVNLGLCPLSVRQMKMIITRFE